MLRISRIIREVLSDAPARPTGSAVFPGPVVIWNLTRRCNLSCLHCYSSSKDVRYMGEIDTATALGVVDDLASMPVTAIVLSGGEPLLREDVFEIARHSAKLGIHTALSTNGALIRPDHVARLREAGIAYVGISLDGRESTHDVFRGRRGAYQDSLAGLRLCRDAGLTVGIRTTLTRVTRDEIPYICDLANREGIERLYFSHLVYAGRGKLHDSADLSLEEARGAVNFLIEKALADQEAGRPVEIVTGNNDADGVALDIRLRALYPEKAGAIRRSLVRWGGNSSGRLIANIDPVGNVHPDPFWSHYSLGNIRHRPFSEIWKDLSDPLLRKLNNVPRPLGGRCGQCPRLDICNGNTRVRAEWVTGDPWAPDPACYVTDKELVETEETVCRAQV